MQITHSLIYCRDLLRIAEYWSYLGVLDLQELQLTEAVWGDKVLMGMKVPYFLAHRRITQRNLVLAKDFRA